MIIKFTDLGKIRLKNKNKKIVFAGGVFDLIHIGHIDFLRQAKKQGDILVIGLSSDRKTQLKKGLCRPILKEEERIAILNSIKYVDYVFISPFICGGKSSFPEILKNLKPDIIFSRDKNDYDKKNIIKAYKLTLKYRKSKKMNSTTNIINKILLDYPKNNL